VGDHWGWGVSGGLVFGEGRLGKREGCREGTYNFDSPIPGAGAESVLGNKVPMNGKDFALVLLPGLHGKLIQGDIEELDGAISCRNDDLVLVGF